MSDSVESRVRGVIVEQLGVTEEQIERGADFKEDLGADSLDAVEMVMAIEEEFEIEIPDEDADKFVTVGDLVDYVASRI